MRPKNTLLIFARAPRLGTVKRRLAKGVGARAALRFYRGQLAALLHEVSRDARWRTVLVATPDRARVRWPRRVAVRDQGRGDLGQRMARAMRPHRRVVLIGSDIPGIRCDDIAAAFRALGRARAVFGPAEDGGYWLVGYGPQRAAQPFLGVRWSGEHALADSMASLGKRSVALLRPLRDVDTVADLRAIAATRCADRPVAAPASSRSPRLARVPRHRG